MRIPRRTSHTKKIAVSTAPALSYSQDSITGEIHNQLHTDMIQNLDNDSDIDAVEGVDVGDEVDEVEEEEEIDENDGIDEEEGEEENEGEDEEDKRRLPPADDFANLANRLMKPVPDYPVKDEAHFVWEIKDWNAVRREQKVRGPQFECGGFKWNVLLFPRVNNDVLSLYMEPHPPADANGVVDPKWYVCAQFALDVWNPAHPQSHYPSGSSHRFNAGETDWGFSSFATVRDLAGANSRLGCARPILEKNQLNITGYVRVIDDSSTGVLWHNFLDYDSKTSTSFVGLNNQGATCYLNSLLQSYYTTKAFRDLVFQIPTLDAASGPAAVPLALQRIFYLLLSSEVPVGTMELTKSFGWDSSDAFTQHDVQELNRVLMDKLESAMKGTPIENRLNDLFVGKMKSYVKCVNVPYESARVEDFWDIQLNVRGFANLEASFRNYIEIEMLDGENKYQAGDEYGYQDAKKGVVFTSFPPILHLQLKRFEYDFMVDDLVKIDDYFEFPDRVDLSPYLDADLPASVKNENWNYKLHGVLVHQGSISNGHYYALIKPSAHDSTWLRFDDDKVWKATPTQVFRENFGASVLTSGQFQRLTRVEQNEYLIRRATSAYMLVYYRESELESVLPETDDSALVPAHVAEQVDREKLEVARLDAARREALYYMRAYIVTVDSFIRHNGFDVYPDLHDPRVYDENAYDSRAFPVSLKVRKDMRFSRLYGMVAGHLGYANGTGEVAGAGENATEIAETPGDTAENAVPVDDDDSITDSVSDDAATDVPFELIAIKHRNNKTARPDEPIPTDLRSLSCAQVYLQSFKRKFDDMVFFVEEPRKELFSIQKSPEIISPDAFDINKLVNKINSNTHVTPPSKEDTLKIITIYLKYFDPVSDQVHGLTFVKTAIDKPVSLLTVAINNLLQFAPETDLHYFEEISHSRVEQIDPMLSFEKNELGSGDTLTVQLADVHKFAHETSQFGSLKDYYHFLATRMHVTVKPFSAGDDEEDADFVENDRESPDSADSVDSLDLWISSLYSYETLAKVIAQNLRSSIDPAYLRLFVVDSHGARFPIASHLSLLHIFTKQMPLSSVTQLEYEVLNIPLKEYESLKSVKISWMSSILQFHTLDVLVPKTSTVADLVKKLIHKVSVPRELWSNLLVWAASNDNKYADLVKFDQLIDDVSDSFELLCGYFPAEVEILVTNDMFKRFDDDHVTAEDIEDEILRDEFEKALKYLKLLNIIPVFHFHKMTTYTHSKPFIFAVFPEEPFDETKQRLRKKLGLGSQAFDKIKIAIADMNDKGRYLDFDKTDFNLFHEISTFGSSVSLALDHPDRNPKRANPFDKGISIK